MTMSMTRQQAGQRLQEVQAALYQNIIQREQLENEARSLAGYLNGSQVEDNEKAQAAQQEQTTEYRPEAE